jgi:hypothetical protein
VVLEPLSLKLSFQVHNYGKNRKEFWNTHYKKGAIVLDFVDFEYTRIVIDTADALKIVNELNSGEKT